MAIVIGNLAATTSANHFVDLRLDITTQINSDNNKQNDVATAVDDEATKIRLRNLLLTLPGQMVLDPAFGCDLNQFLFDSIDKRRAYVIGTYIRDQIRKYIPTIQISNIIVAANVDDRSYEIEIDYVNPIISLQTQQQLLGFISQGSGMINFA